MCEPPSGDQPPDFSDNLLIQAMAQYLDEALSTEGVIRELLARVGFDNPDLTVEECVAKLVQAHLRLAIHT